MLKTLTNFTVQGQTINDLGGGSGKSGEKKINGYSPGKKNSTQQPGRKNKLNPTTWNKKKSSTQQPGKFGKKCARLMPVTVVCHHPFTPALSEVTAHSTVYLHLNEL